MRYTDELEPLLAHEEALRQAIALRIAEEQGQPRGATPTQEQVELADEAIAKWSEQGEDDQDMAAFRPMGPLQHLLADHRQTCERIFDLRDRRLS